MRSIVAALAMSIFCNVHAQSAPADANAGPLQSVSSPGAVAAVADATGAALQADMPRALEALRRVPASEFIGADQTFRTAMLERFGGKATDDLPTALNEPFARAMLATYRAYWRAALANPGRRAQQEANLLGALKTLTGRQDVVDLDAMEPVVRKRLEDAGYHSLQGQTGPLRELMLWTRQELREYRVALPGGEHATRVFVLDGFASLGWGDYATCGRRGTGGWATADALYVVVPRYASLDSEEFQVTFLGHETQHYADLTDFPGLPSWELEYRAKLVELAQAVKTRERVVRKFLEDQGDDPASPHSYANKRVLAALVRRLNLNEGVDLVRTDVAKLNAAAAEELRHDTWRRRATRPPTPAPPREGSGQQ